MEWQPIETAPKDGTLIIAWCQHRDTPCTVEEQEAWGVYSAHVDAFFAPEHKGTNGVTIARWGGEYLTDDWQIPNWWFEDDYFEQPVNPTHWMPIPDPPKNAALTKENNDDE